MVPLLSRHRATARVSVVFTTVFVSVWIAGSSARQQLSADRQSPRAAAEQLIREGDQLRLKQEREFLRQAIDKFNQSIPLWQAAGDDTGRALALEKVAAVYRVLGDNPRALEFLHQALSLRRAGSDQARTAETLSDIAGVYLSVGEMPKAIDSYNEALRIARTIGDRKVEASALTGMGRVHDAWGEYEQAVTDYTGALQLARAMGDRRAEAAATGNLGRLHQTAGDSQQALEQYREALRLFQELNDRSRMATALHLIGAVYHSLGDLRQAIGFYDEAITVARTLGNRQAEAQTLNTMAMVRSALGEHAAALTLLDAALPLARAVADPRLVAYTLHNYGDLYSAMGQWQKALEYELEALPLRRAARDRDGEAHVLLQIGFIRYKLGDATNALTAFTDALAIAKDLRDQSAEALASVGLARVERDAGHLIVARDYLNDALGRIESVRNGIAIQELRTSYSAGVQDYYELYIDVLMQLHKSRPSEGFDSLALQASERARARSFVELLAESRGDIRQGVDPTLLEREQALHRRLNAKAERQRQVANDPANRQQAETMARELDRVATELQELEGQIRARSPHYATLTQPQLLNAREIQQQVLDDNSLLLEYSLGKERSYLWAVTKTGVRAYDLPARADIEAAARRVYSLLTARQGQPGESPAAIRAKVREAETSYPAAAAALSQMILGPIVPRITAGTRLLIVSDGALQYIPFAALPAPSSGAENTAVHDLTVAAPLIVEHEIVNLPSASVLAVLRKELAGRVPAPRTLAVLADPVFDRDDARVRRDGAQTATARDRQGTAAQRPGAGSLQVGPGEPLARLPFTRREAESILAAVPPNQQLKALDFHASRTTLTGDSLRQYRIVHFATHAFLDDEHPELSGIVLSLVDERGEPQDGFIRLHELYNLTMPADLVVLSACETALGREVRGEGIVGLTRGLMYAGAARVVASLWKVDDAATADLMKRFYAGMLSEQPLSPAAALRAAQVAIWQQKRWSAPYYWAAFMLQGL